MSLQQPAAAGRVGFGGTGTHRVLARGPARPPWPPRPAPPTADRVYFPLFASGLVPGRKAPKCPGVCARRGAAERNDGIRSTTTATVPAALPFLRGVVPASECPRSPTEAGPPSPSCRRASLWPGGTGRRAGRRDDQRASQARQHESSRPTTAPSCTWIADGREQGSPSLGGGQAPPRVAGGGQTTGMQDTRPTSQGRPRATPNHKAFSSTAPRGQQTRCLAPPARLCLQCLHGKPARLMPALPAPGNLRGNNYPTTQAGRRAGRRGGSLHFRAQSVTNRTLAGRGWGDTSDGGGGGGFSRASLAWSSAAPR